MATRQGIKFPKRGEVYLVNFDPTIGAEIKKIRPALVLQNNIANEHSLITIVAAITSKFSESLYPIEVFVKALEGGLETNSIVLLNQIRSIDKRRLAKRLGELNAETMRRVDCAIEISLGLLKF